ncbi:transcriptional regulator [Herbaspirillum sp. meg3]|jgi:DNA-binding IclR family transcriptional regulator|uniref:helix-turn-helix domain-containing protein n=1 Tax=Herbaspirillum sp. meg3 TaxID=2025949 RepID=UPI000B988C71|nr:helix-turn-helix domain-containing protein [Herbaspirillum sp. meg3]ASU39323.1 transcriptional regulator [Herbaspirillum sp. meg3]
MDDAHDSLQDQLPPELIRILDELYQEYQRSQAPLSLARLSKRTELRMSTLRRFLTALEEAGIATVVVNDDGTGNAILTAAGLKLHG